MWIHFCLNSQLLHSRDLIWKIVLDQLECHLVQASMEICRILMCHGHVICVILQIWT